MAESNDSSDGDYYDDLAEEWEGGYGKSGGGGSSNSKKKGAVPTTVGRRRVGASQAWGSDASVCPKACTKKCCCKGPTKTPTM